jgi:hypothetical protein
MLSRLKNDLMGLNLSRPDVAKTTLATKYPLNGDYLVEVRRLWQRGVDEGWLCEGDVAGARGTRLSPPTKYFPFAIDALRLEGAAAPHGHPKGEVCLSWAVHGEPKLCGQEAGWMVSAPGSKHVPHVVGGSMFVLQFLPDGKVDWSVKLKVPSTPRAVKAEAAKATARRSTSLAEVSRAASAASRSSSPRRASAR